MQICFSLPHVFGTGSSQTEFREVQGVLNKALADINGRSDLASRSTMARPQGAAIRGRSSEILTTQPGRGLATLSRSDEHPSRVCFHLPFAFNPQSTQVEDSRVLRILLETLIDIDRIYLRNRPTTPHLYDGRVIYGRTRVWDPISALYRRGYGDCKSLSAAMIAQYRNAGVEAEPVFRWVDAQRANLSKGNTNYHILVQTSKGFEDPSKVLGMGRDALY